MKAKVKMNVRSSFLSLHSGKDTLPTGMVVALPDMAEQDR